MVLQVKRGSSRGQAIILAALVLPIIALLSIGVAEWGQTYLLGVRLERAAAVAATTIADRLSAQDLLGATPPIWAGLIAEDVGRAALAGMTVTGTVLWGPGGSGTAPAPPDVPADVPIDVVENQTETLNWRHAHDAPFEIPSYQVDSADRGQIAAMTYADSTMMPGTVWRDALGDAHTYQDASVEASLSTIGVFGVGLGGWTLQCFFKLCWMQWVWVIASGGTDSPFITSARQVDAARTVTGASGLLVPWDWRNWVTRGATSDRWAHWDRWLTESAREWISLPTDQRGSSNQAIGPYGRFVGAGTSPGVVSSSSGLAVTRQVLVELQTQVRPATPMFRSILPPQVRRLGLAHVERAL